MGRIIRNDTDGQFHLIVSENRVTHDLGILHVQAGDHGMVLAIDVYPQNVLRTRYVNGLTVVGSQTTGSAYAVPQRVLQGTELDGACQCSSQGQSVGTLTANGAAMQTVTADGQMSQNAALHYNQLDTGTLTPVNGVITQLADGVSAGDGVTILPLSSSLALLQRYATGAAALCHPTAN